MALEDYNILRVIGKGTYGEVHLVTHKKDKKQYVIKKLGFTNASAKERKSAEQEAKLLSNLRHPNIVSYKDSFECDSGHLYIVMGFAEGGDLYTKLRDQREKKEPLGELQTVRWYIQICMALQYLHERRILHRDLKTQNIFLTKTQIIKVGDLGIAKVLESANDMATTLIGTPYYMSPELFSNKPYNHKSDVWALGCCMYEMVTLKHAFNAKDISSLMYKILKGKMPIMPGDYPSALCDLIRDMLNQNPDKRPSVNRILRNPYIKKHIQLFLEESNKKRRVNQDKSSRKSSVASNGSHQPSSRKTSTNSRGNLSPSPHPPASGPDPAKPTRSPKGRSPNVSPQMNSPLESKGVKKTEKVTGPKADKHELKGVDPTSGASKYRNLHNRVPVTPPSYYSEPTTEESKSSQRQPPKPKDSGIYMNILEAPNIEKITYRKSAEIVTGVSQIDISDEIENKPSRVASASSSCSTSSQASESSAKSKSRRPLPKCPKTESTPNKRESPSDDLQNSGESIVSVTSSVANSEAGGRKSARQRRRESKQKENQIKPAIIEEIRKSRNSGFKQGVRASATGVKCQDIIDGKKTGSAEREEMTKKESYRPDSGDAKSRQKNAVKATEVLLQQSEQPKNEEEEFMTLLHTTLHLGSGKEATASEDGDSPVSVGESDFQKAGLSPVPELSENSSSYGDRPPKLTPAATPIHIPAPLGGNGYGNVQRNVSAKTLQSTQRLMDRIVALRKECIHGLGVPLLHKAYEVLDANQDDEILQKELISLLGPVRFETWSGKIWQLKYCEESLFGHCGSITGN